MKHGNSNKISPIGGSDLTNYFSKCKFTTVHKLIHLRENSPFNQIAEWYICHQFLQSNCIKNSIYCSSPSHAIGCYFISAYMQQFLKGIASGPHITYIFNLIIQLNNTALNEKSAIPSSSSGNVFIACSYA